MATLLGAADALPRLAYNHPGLVVDLGVGLWAWPLPMDYNRDGLMDLVVVCTDRPHRGTWYFENTGRIDNQTELPLFRPARRIADAVESATVSYAGNLPIVTATTSLRRGNVYQFGVQVFPNFIGSNFGQPVTLPVPTEIHAAPGTIRQNQWQLVDFDGDGDLDLSLGIDFWGDYGAVSPISSGWDGQGRWKNGPLRGYVYLLLNTGSNERPVFSQARKVEAGDKPVDTFGMPSPMWGDFRASGKLDLICGEFLDGFTFYENVGTRTEPRFADGRKLTVAGREDWLKMDLCMITPVAVDFDGDGDLDIVCGDEDGRVALIENTGEVVNRMPQFRAPRYFRQEANEIKFGALITPWVADWDEDGLDDIICGSSAGYLAFVRNLGGEPIRWAAPELLRADGVVIREQAGANGSVQGPAEAKWGYTIPTVGDWDGDGLQDIITNGIWGKIVWYRNVGTRHEPRLAKGVPVEFGQGHTSPKLSWNWWHPNERDVVTQWRTSPVAIDWNDDGLIDLMMVDPDGYLALFERRRSADGDIVLEPGRRIFRGEGVSAYDANGKPTNNSSGLLRLNSGEGGRSGRRTFVVVDWDGDGVRDLLVNSSLNVDFLKGLGRDSDGFFVFRNEGPLSEHALAAHATKPAVFKFAGKRSLLIGAEDGFIYRLPHTK